MQDKESIRRQVVAWFAAHARPLPWRDATVTAWGVLVSEVMAQQTPVARVEEPWQTWMARWATPADLAKADVADVLRAWGGLGYPRRALRLAEAARRIAEEHNNQVPDDEAALLALPGVGRYTAAAVLAFAYQRHSLVLDTNIRRVLARLDGGEEYPPPAQTAGERARASAWLPDGDADCARWSAAVMELGALVCTARSVVCTHCPVSEACVWAANGYPSWTGAPRVGQTWQGTDRQCRGRIMATLRSYETMVLADIAWPDTKQLERCMASLVVDGLAHQLGDRFQLGPAQ